MGTKRKTFSRENNNKKKNNWNITKTTILHTFSFHHSIKRREEEKKKESPNNTHKFTVLTKQNYEGVNFFLFSPRNFVGLIFVWRYCQLRNRHYSSSHSFNN